MNMRVWIQVKVRKRPLFFLRSRELCYELRKECVVGKIQKQMSELVGDRERTTKQQ